MCIRDSAVTVFSFATLTQIDPYDSLRYWSDQDLSPSYQFPDAVTWYDWLIFVAFMLQFIGAAAVLCDATKRAGGSLLILTFLAALIAVSGNIVRMEKDKSITTFMNALFFGDTWLMSITVPMGNQISWKNAEWAPIRARFDEDKLNQTKAAWFMLNIVRWVPALCLGLSCFSSTEEEESVVVYPPPADDKPAPPAMSVAASGTCLLYTSPSPRDS